MENLANSESFTKNTFDESESAFSSSPKKSCSSVVSIESDGKDFCPIAKTNKTNKDHSSLNSYLQELHAFPKFSEIEYKYNAVSIFSGGGGLDAGAAWAGFQVKFASDLEQPHCDTVKHNFSDCETPAMKVEDLTKDIILKYVKHTKVDLLVGGPPCQAFSILGKRQSVNDPRGKLIYEYARLINELEPEAFIFENVPGLLNVNNGKDWRKFLRHLKSGETKYKLFVQSLNAADFGVPQVRHRIFIVGFKNKKAKFKFPSPTHRKKTENESADPSNNFWLPAKLALENVEGKENHRIRIHGKPVEERYKTVVPGTKDKVDHTARIHPDRPAGTVLVGSKNGGGRPHIHPVEPRHITVREAARLQSFPDWYVFQGPESWQYRAVGNAVPPILGRAICLEIFNSLNNLTESK